jgi:tetratricopeptide (TPR) repeat protein
MNSIPTDRILSKLDDYFSKNDYIGAERHLKYWFDEASALRDERGKIQICNELIGLSRKVGHREDAFKYADIAINTLCALDRERSVTAATTYINIATAYKAFGFPDTSLPYFQKAMEIYKKDLPNTDSRLGGLYNNMALSLADLDRFSEAYGYFTLALEVMSHSERGELEQAITYLNIASALEKEKGLVDADAEISQNLDKAAELLDIYADATDGYYAFVCEKCASVFGYYGYFLYEKELMKRSQSIYERS